MKADTKLVIDCSLLPTDEEHVTEDSYTAPDPDVAERWAREADERRAARARARRNVLLAASDWTQAADAPLAAAQREAWAAYRQQLRDNPAGPWPDPPG